MKIRSDTRVYKDPVCGMEVSRNTAADEVIYKGKDYYFCSPACSESFITNPEKYLTVHRQHGLKAG